MAIQLSGYLAPTPNRIWLKGYQFHYDEAIIAAANAPSPGHLLEFLSDGTVRKNLQYGKRMPVAVAIEDALQGLSISDAYAVSTPCRFIVPRPGDQFQARLAAAAPAVVIGDMLTSAGDGTVVKPLSGGSLLYSEVAASAAVTASSTETLFDKNYTLPANTLQAGDVLHIRAEGTATATNSTDTLTAKLYIGGLTGILVASTGALDVANGDEFYFDATVTLRTVGASGTLVGAGIYNIGVPGTATDKAFLLASTAIDTTTSKVIGVSATWSTTNSGNSCRLDTLEVTLERTGDVAKLLMAVGAVDNSAGSSEAFIPVMVI